MTKASIVKTWIAGLVVFAAGLAVVGVSVGAMLAYGGHFEPAPYGVPNSYNFVPAFDNVFWTSVTFIVLGAIVAFAGGLVQLVAWVGAMVNTYRLVDRTWFVVLLLGGVLGVVFAPIGFAVMVAYVMAGPDGMAVAQPPAPSPVAQPTSFAPAS